MAAKRLECTWDEFRETLRRRGGSPIEPFYRGQAQAHWPLVAQSKRLALAAALGHEKLAAKHPGLAAANDFSSWSFDGQLEVFRRTATGIPGPDISKLDRNDLEAIARHSGLCSNLLDWTESPYVAAFFAYSSALNAANGGRLMSGEIDRAPVEVPAQPVAIWRLAVSSDLWIEGEFEPVTTLSALNFWQKAQSGVFTRFSHKRFADIERYLESRGLEGRLQVFLLPGREALRALADLKDMNITFATLFPDLRGAALHANFASVLLTF